MNTVDRSPESAGKTVSELLRCVDGAKNGDSLLCPRGADGIACFRRLRKKSQVLFFGSAWRRPTRDREGSPHFLRLANR
jgi:hypothetical protein